MYSIQFAEITAWLTEYGVDDQESRHEIIELVMALDDHYRTKLVELIKEKREEGKNGNS